MQHSTYGEEMLDLMEMAEEITNNELVEKKGIDKKSVKKAVYGYAKDVWGPDTDYEILDDMINKVFDEYGDKIKDEEDAVGMVKNMIKKEESKDMGYSGQAFDTSGPGAKKRTTRNDYTRQEISDMLKHAQKFVKDGKQPKSWKYEQDWLNQIGASMKEFMNIKPGNPEYEEGEMQGDHHARPYSKTSYGNADKGKFNQDMKSGGPGPQRGSKMNKDYDINKRRSTKRSTRTDYNK